MEGRAQEKEENEQNNELKIEKSENEEKIKNDKTEIQEEQKGETMKV